MNFPPSLALVPLLLAVLSAPTATAQSPCTPVPSTGCAGALPPSCSGSSQIGNQLSISCIDNGRAPFTYLLIGQCEFAPIQFPQSFLCITQPCYLGVSLGISISVPTPFTPVTIAIPASSNLVGVQVCSQCVDVILSRGCLSLSQATSILVTQ